MTDRAARTAPAPAVHVEPAFAPPPDALLGALEAVGREQLPGGEIATYFRSPGGGLEYRRSALASTYVHDALACFDPGSAWFDTRTLELIPRSVRPTWVRQVAAIRRRIRSFLAHDEHCDGSWRFLGRSGGSGPDIDTSACAAAVLLETRRRTASQRWTRHVEFLSPQMNRQSSTGFAACANAARFLALAGEPVEGLAAELAAEARQGALDVRARGYLHPLAPAYCAARAWTQALLPGWQEVRELLAATVAHSRPPAGESWSALSASLALSVLELTGVRQDEADQARNLLLRTARRNGGWGYAPFLEDGGGAGALTSAFAMAALAQYNH